MINQLKHISSTKTALLSLTGNLNQTSRFSSSLVFRDGALKPRNEQGVEPPNREYRRRRKFFHTRWEDQPELDETPYLIDRVLPSGMLLVVYAPSGLGKTDAALQMANAVANGTEFHGHSANQGDVLYLDYEMGHKLLRKYGKRLNLKGNIRAEHEVPLADVVSIIEEALQDQARLVIIDSYASLANQSGNENAVNSNAVAEQVLKPLSELAHRSGVTIMVLHHTNKGGIQYDGSQRIKGLADGFYRLSLNRKTKTISLKEEKGRFETESLEWDASNHPLLKGTTTEDEEEENERLTWVIDQLQEGPKTTDDLKGEYSGRFNVSSKSLERDLDDAVRQGLIVKEKNGRKNVFQLPDTCSHAA